MYNRLFLRRLVINVFWSLVYVFAVGYLAYVNFVSWKKSESHNPKEEAEENEVALDEEEEVAVER